MWVKSSHLFLAIALLERCSRQPVRHTLQWVKEHGKGIYFWELPPDCIYYKTLSYAAIMVIDYHCCLRGLNIL